MSPRRWQCRGFSLLEAIVVLILLVIMAAVVLSRFGRQGIDGVAEAAVLRAHLRYAQARAMADTVPWGLLLASDRYTLLRNGAAAGQLPGEAGSVHVLQRVSMSAGTGTLNFNSWGVPCNAAGVVLGANHTITLAGDGSRTIVVTRNTGFVN